MCVCVVSVIVKHPVLPPCVVDGRSRNPLYYYYYYLKPEPALIGCDYEQSDLFEVFFVAAFFSPRAHTESALPKTNAVKKYGGF